MRHLNKILFLAMLGPLAGFAQSHFLPGYVVTSSGDTVRGFIDFRDWGSNPDNVAFKKNLSDPEKTDYLLQNTTAFSVNGITTYKRFTCHVSMDETNTSRLGESRDTSFKTETVFLKVLQYGAHLALYSYADDLKTRYYIGEAPDYTPQELVFRVYSDPNNNSDNHTIYENTYQKQLFALAIRYKKMNNEDLTATIEKSSYTADDLLEIVSKINDISKADYQKKYAAHTKLVFYAGVTANISSTSSSSGSPYEDAGGTSSSSVLPGVSFGLSIIPSPISDKVELRAEVAVVPAKFNSTYQLKVSPYVPAQASYDQLALSFMPEIIFNAYNGRNFKFYFGGGLALTHYSFSNAYFGNPKSGNSPSFPQEPFFFTTNDDSFVLKAGFRIHRNIEIFYNYFTSVQTSHSGYFKFGYVNSQIGISYLFGK